MHIIHLGDTLLREKSQPVLQVTDDIRSMIAQMFVTLKQEDGLGLAAPQIGELLRIFVVCIHDGINRAFINPHIIATSTEASSYEEGCLSVPKVYAKLERPAKITIQALNEKGKPFTLEASGLLARVIQHEYDHLEGIIFIDRVSEAFKVQTEKMFAKQQERKMKQADKKNAKQESDVPVHA